MIDVLDCDGFITGKRASRVQVHKEGLYHRAVHVYLFDLNWNILLQTRSHLVDHYPNSLSISAAGHVDAGENSTHTAKREIEEELGLSPDQYDLNFMFSVRQETQLSEDYIDNQFNDIFTCFCPSGANKIRLNSNEVSAVELIPMSQFINLVEARDAKLPPFYEREVKMLKYLLKL